jgi:hypothetical protein
LSFDLSTDPCECFMRCTVTAVTVQVKRRFEVGL